MRLTMEIRDGLTKDICQRYRKATKKEKGAILNTFVETTGYDRGYARWLLRHHGLRVQVKPKVILEGDAQRVPQRRPVVKYGPEVLAPLKEIWEMLDYISSKRLVAALPEVIPRLKACGELRLTKTVRRKLLRISASTVDRLLKSERARYAVKPRGGTKPGTLLKHQVSRPGRAAPGADPNLCRVERGATGVPGDRLGGTRRRRECGRLLPDFGYDRCRHRLDGTGGRA